MAAVPMVASAVSFNIKVTGQPETSLQGSILMLTPTPLEHKLAACHSRPHKLLQLVKVARRGPFSRPAVTVLCKLRRKGHAKSSESNYQVTAQLHTSFSLLLACALGAIHTVVAFSRAGCIVIFTAADLNVASLAG